MERRSRVESLVGEWALYANVTFEFDSDDEDAEIRVGFAKGRDESVIGKEARDVPYPGTTMNLGSVGEDAPMRQQRAAVLHEFGHALGCIHEHQTKGVDIPWNRPKVYKFYEEKYGWDRQDVDDNVFFVYAEDMVMRSDFDPFSIMVYAIQPELTDGKFKVDETFDLSTGDIELIAQVYGSPPPPQQ